MTTPETKIDPKKRPRSRLTLLLVLLAAAGLTKLAMQFGSFQEKWLAGRSLEELKRLAVRPDADPLTHLVYGEKLTDARRIPEALSEFQQADKALQPDQKDSMAVRVKARLGYTLTLAGKDEEAVDPLNRARSLDDDSLYVHLGFGNIYFHRHVMDHAIAQFRLAVAIDPQSAEAQFMLGRSLLENRETLAAVEELKRALAHAPHRPEIQVELGHAYALQSQFPQAADCFRAALLLAPEDPDCLRDLGAVLGKSARTQAQYAEAAAVLEQNLRLDPKNENLNFSLGQLHLRFLHLQEARTCLKRCVDQNPSYTDAWFNLSRVEQLLGNQPLADQYHAKFQKLSTLHENTILAERRVASHLEDPTARLDLARRFRAEGNILGAYWQLKIDLKLKPDHAPARAALDAAQPAYKALMAENAKTHLVRDNAGAFGPPPPAELLRPEAGLKPPWEAQEE